MYDGRTPGDSKELAYIALRGKSKHTNTIFSHLQPARVVRSLQTLHDDRERRAHFKGVNHFYCAKLCVSAVFGVVRCPSVCLPVRPFVTLVYCIGTAEDTVKIPSHPPVARSFYFFDSQHQYPFIGAQKWGGKFCDFRLKSPFISKTVRDRPLVAMEVNMKSYVAH